MQRHGGLGCCAHREGRACLYCCLPIASGWVTDPACRASRCCISQPSSASQPGKSHILPVGVGNTATASGCIATKDKGETVVRAASAGSGPVSWGLADAVAAPRAQGAVSGACGQRCLHACPQPRWSANPSAVRCTTSATSLQRELPEPAGNHPSCPTSSCCLSALWQLGGHS